MAWPLVFFHHPHSADKVHFPSPFQQSFPEVMCDSWACFLSRKLMEMNVLFSSLSGFLCVGGMLL